MPDTDSIHNQHHDEEVVVSDAESVPDNGEDSEPSDADDAPARGGGGVGQQSQEESIEFGDEDESRDESLPGKRPKAQMVENKEYDEAVDVSSSSSIDEADAAPPPPPHVESKNKGGGGGGGGGVGARATGQASSSQSEGDGEEDKSETSSEEEDEDEGEGVQAAQGYNATEYANLQVSEEVKELFQYITRYKPQTIELETKLKPFIPDYIPAIGEMDPFLKMPRPDGKAEVLGLAVLDEPAAHQTDPTVLDLQLRAISTQAALQPIVIDSVDAAANPQKIETWMKNMKDLHDGNPAPKVDYTRAMPEIDTLKQMWSPEMEEALAEAELPSAVLNVDTTAFARIVCAILDIPVYTSLTESLHLLFSLYSEFKHSTQDAMFPHLDPL